MNTLMRSKRPTLAAAFILTVFTLGVGAGTTPDFSQQARLVSGGTSDDYANTGVAISGNTAVVASVAGYHVYTRSGSTWAQQTVLVPSDGLAGCSFRRPVAIEGNTIIAGCQLTSANGNARQGAVYVFVRTGSSWTQVQRLLASDAAADDRFGTSVALSGANLIVGAPQKDIGGTDVGRAYVFVHNGTQWSEQGTLTATDAAVFNYFGNYVAIDGSGNASVGNSPNPGAGSAAAYVFVRSGSAWSQQQKLSVCEPSGSGSQCRFGSSLAIRGNTLAVGNLFLNVGANNAQGGVYVFTRTGSVWSQLVRLTPSDGATNGLFGSSVALGDSTLVIGAHADIGFPGKVYVYDWNGSEWMYRQTLMAGTNRNAFGQQVGFDGNSIIAAAPVDAGAPGSFIGAAYIFARPAPAVRSPFDFDRDGKTDIGIFRPIMGAAEWWVNRSGDGQTFALQFGSSTDRIAPADYTGDGKTDIAFFRPASGEWFVLRSEDFSFFALLFGTNGDIPVPADYDADGKADFAVFRPSSSTWFLSQSSGAPTRILQFGIAGDVPVVADYDGDGKADVGIFRHAAGGGEWWIDRSNAGLLAMQFGAATDKPVQGDYTGDGKADVAVWRTETGEWLIVRSEDFSFFGFPFGTTGDVVTPGDYDGDGKFDAAVFRPSSATWFIGRTTGGTHIVPFGANGDRPIPNAFVP